MAGVRWRKRGMVDGLVEIHRKRFAADGLEFLLGDGRFVAPRMIEVSMAAVARGGSRQSACSSISERTRPFPTFQAWPLPLH
jgi:hypothetical protein